MKITIERQCDMAGFYWNLSADDHDIGYSRFFIVACWMVWRRSASTTARRR